jgi:oligopeptide/dipeptide ABC transporter ATP-binding protein
VKAVHDVSFDIFEGEIVGLVGESGCGKSSLGKAMMRLIPSASGQIMFDQKDLLTFNSSDLQKSRRQIQMIFQDPFSSLNPRMKVESILKEPLVVHRLGSSQSHRPRVQELLKMVGLRPEAAQRYPHEFSGGQRQRIGIARALAVEPRLIIADEPVSALDVSIQAQIINLLKGLREDLRLTYLFISHDLNVVRYLCDRVVVMYLGRVMEVLTREQLADKNFPFHPYTQALLESAPKKHPGVVKDFKPLTGDIPSPARPPKGCVFHPRCREKTDECHQDIPVLKGDIRKVACWQRT